MTWQAVKDDRRFRLIGAPAYKGFVARKYGPRVRIPRQSQMYWVMTSRRFVKWLEATARRNRRHK